MMNTKNNYKQYNYGYQVYIFINPRSVIKLKGRCNLKYELLDLILIWVRSASLSVSDR